MSNDIFRRWLDLLFWWVPRTEQARPEAKEAAPAEPQPSTARDYEASARRPVEAAEKARRPVEAAKATPDDLTVIKGIGPVVQDKLRSLGITTFSDLARANPDDLLEQLKGSQPLSAARVRSWAEAARTRAKAQG